MEKIRIFEAFAGYGSQAIACKRLQRDFPNDIEFEFVGTSEIEPSAIKAYQAIHGDTHCYGNICTIAPRVDGCCGTIDARPMSNLIMTTNTKTDMEYKEHPTKEDLLEYFGQRIKVRKMSPREAFRLMDVDDSDIDKMMNATETVTLKNCTVKTKKAISKTALYKLAGNSIVVSCLYHLFRTLLCLISRRIRKRSDI